MVSLESAQVELSNKVNKDNGERSELNRFIEFEKSVEEESNLHFTDFTEDRSNESTEIFIVGGELSSQNISVIKHSKLKPQI